MNDGKGNGVGGGGDDGKKIEWILLAVVLKRKDENVEQNATIATTLTHQLDGPTDGSEPAGRRNT